MLKLAISGKGGVGKTTLAAMLAHLFVREGYSVTAIDCDSSINLPSALGVNEEVKPLAELREVIEQRVKGPFGTFRYNPKVDDIFEEYSVRNSDGVRVLVLGTIEKGGEGCFCPENAFLRAILRHAIFRDDVLILDMEAGIEHLGRGTAKGVDVLIAVVEPGTRAIETLKRIEKLAADIEINRIAVVVNKFLDTPKSRELLNTIKHPILGVIPYDQCFVQADMENIPPYEVCNLEPFEKIKENLLKFLGKQEDKKK
ncbi:ATP-binding protein [Archaeoglobus veneficus]|uniref:Cobyrinic acid ac-diamide synthase n=1 Tax=Archaeoglobus veneficus (strain DSM 11195 / SNP6) TaxID=693661 RepID=F2KN01_ARCVS|nr:P-loop NTPase [Archaeoglobus veneficus]AEA47277.1 Cobyrinic acid ac-diamide synthase [Archaeoglobus veneficus SNP6]